MANNANTSDLVVEGLLDYLKETRQENLLPEVTHVLESELVRSKRAEKIVVESAIVLEKNQLENITNIVKKYLKLDLPAVSRVNKALIGGFTVKVGDWFLDASLRRDLENLSFVLAS